MNFNQMLKLMFIFILALAFDFIHHYFFIYCMHLYLKKCFDEFAKMNDWNEFIHSGLSSVENFDRNPMLSYTAAMWVFFICHGTGYQIFGMMYLGLWTYMGGSDIEMLKWMVEFYKKFKKSYDCPENSNANGYIYFFFKKHMVMFKEGTGIISILTFIPIEILKMLYWIIVSLWEFLKMILSF